MPGAIVHLLIVDKLKQNLIDDIDMNKLYLGSLIPDAIHFIPNFTREDKKKAHLRLGIRDAHFHSGEGLKLYHERLNIFIENLNNVPIAEIEYYLGYLIHLISDELFVLSTRRDFVLHQNALGLVAESKESFYHFIKDIDLIDRHMLSHVTNKKAMIKRISRIEGFNHINGISVDCVKGNSERIIRKKFDCEEPLELTYFITEQMILKLIDQVAEEIKFRFSSHHILKDYLKDI